MSYDTRAAFLVNNHVIPRKPKLEVNPNRNATKCQFINSLRVIEAQSLDSLE